MITSLNMPKIYIMGINFYVLKAIRQAETINLNSELHWKSIKILLH